MANTILKSYKRDNDDELQTSITRVVDGWENSPNFLDPPPAYVALKTLLPEFRSAVAAAKTRDSVAISRKKDLKVKAIDLMSELDAWVTEKCKGDRTMLLESGFYLSGDKNRVTPEPEITKLEVVLGRAGILTTKIKKVARCRGYWHQYATEHPSSETNWHSESSLDPEFTFTGLTSGRTYWVRVMIYSKSGQWIYSPVESRIVQ